MTATTDRGLGNSLRPASIAVVGASPRSFIGQVAIENSRGLGFAGNVYPVGRHEQVAGLECSPSLRDLPEVPDVVLIQVRAELITSIVQEGLRLGSRTFVVPGAGFSDSGELAAEVQSGLAVLRRDHEFTVIGPNCMGFIDLVTGAAPYVGTAPSFLRRGRVGVIAQSGAIVEAVVSAGGRVPVSTVISSGSEAITDFSDYIDFFAEDENTDAVLCFVEALSNPQAAMEATSRLTESGKRMAVCLVGRSATAREGIAAHSGKLASGAKVMAAAFQQAGAVIADDLDELLALGEILATGHVPTGRRIHIVTNSGGEGSLLADIADDEGLVLPPLSEAASTALRKRWPRFHARNPLDPWGTDNYEVIYPEVLRHAAAEAGDILMLAIDQQRTSGAHEHTLGLDLATYLASVSADSNKLRVLLSPTSQDPDEGLSSYCQRAGIALLRGARPALRALGKLAHLDSAGTARTREAAEPQTVLKATLPAGSGGMEEDEVLSILAALGVATPRRRRVTTAEEAVDQARCFQGPVVLKGVAEGLLHKTELGLVKTNLTTPEDVRLAAEAMQRRAECNNIEVQFLLAEQVRGDLEVVVGYKRDAAFGPTVIVGSGGVWAEFLDDVAIHVGALDRAGAERLLNRSRVGQMMAGARGGPLYAEGVLRALCAVSAIGQANPDVIGIDINPLIVGRSHATAVDAVIERRHIERN